MQAFDLAWWVGLVFGAIPLLALAVWHGADACYLASFALSHGRGKSSRLPPGHMGLPFFGESLALLWYFKFARRPDGFVDAKKRAYGDGVAMYRTHLFGSPSVLVCSPAANKFVLQSGDAFPIRWPAPELVGVSSIVNVDGAQHTRIRRFIVSAVSHPRSLQRIARVVQPRVVAALRSWADKGRITAAAEIKRVTFENICMMFISMEPSPLTEKMRKWFADLMDGFREFPLDFPGTAFRRARRSRRKLNAVFREEMESRRKKATWSDNDDLMSGMMQMEDEQGKKLSDDEVLDNIVSMVVAGFESTSTAIMWAAYHLAKTPDALAKLRAENEAVSRSKDGEDSRFITLEDISKMKYTAKVVEETIRLANIASTIFRVANKDVQYGGYTIPKGWQVVVWLRTLHTDEKYYPDPLAFNPDRWNEPAKPGTYQVFGVGGRICAGNMLARLQVTIMLHHLCLGYQWKLLNPDAGVGYLPHPRPVDGAAMAFSKLSTPT